MHRIKRGIGLLTGWVLVLCLPITLYAEKYTWPKDIGVDVWSTPTVADIDGDGKVEIIVGAQDDDKNKDNGQNGCVHIWNYDGKPLSGWPQKTIGGKISNSNPVCADVDPSYKGLEVVIGSNNKKVYIWHADGTLLQGWPKELSAAIVSTIVVKDLDKDGKLDIIAGCTDGMVYALNNKGESLKGWPKRTGGNVRVIAEDITNNQRLEVLAVSDGKIYVWDNKGKLLPGWPKEGEYASIKVGELDLKYPSDYPALEIAAAGKKGFAVFRLDGTICKGWPKEIKGLSGFEIGDIDKDGLLEIIAVLNRGEGLTSLLYAYKPDGKLLNGWPVEVKASPGYPVSACPVLKDLDGDGYLEAIIAHTCYTIRAYDYQGQMVKGFPLDGIGMQYKPPAVYDVDGDGRYELIFGDVSRYLKVHMIGLGYSYKKTIVYQFTPGDKKKGYVIYSMEDPYGNALYDYVPSSKEVKDEISLFASSKEYEPATFSVYTRKDLNKIEVYPGDLKSKSGEKIARENVDIRIVKCWEQTNVGTGKMQMVPELLLKDDRIKLKGHFSSMPVTSTAHTDIPKDTSKQFWLTVYIPEGTKAGLYKGDIYFKPKDAPSSVITLKANVLPITLPKSKKVHAIVGGNPDVGLGWYGEKKVSPEAWEEICRKNLIDMREHGIQSTDIKCPLTGSTAGGKLTIDFTNLEKTLKLLKEVGLGKIIGYDIGYSKINGRPLSLRSWEVNPESDKLFYYTLEKVVAEIEKYLKKNWKDTFQVFYWGIDEPSITRGSYNEMGRDKIEACKNMYDAIHRGGGLTTSCLYPSAFGGIKVLGPLTDLPDYHYDYLFPGTDPKIIKKEAESKKGVWWWWSAYQENPIENRLMAGFILWKSEGTGTKPWGYRAYRERPYDDTAGKNMAIVYPSKDGPVPTLAWEAFREGIDDTRYLTVLTELAEKKEGKKKAEERVVELLANIGLNIRAEAVSLNHKDLQNIRWQIIQKILKLKK